MSRTLPDLFGRASTVAADHARLRDIWARLRKLVSTQDTEAAAPRDEQLQLIGEFAIELTAHFAAEEADSHFGALEEQCHDLRPRISTLRDEHARITVQVTEILTSQATLKPSELNAKVQWLLDDYQRHETAEAALLQEFFARDNAGPL